MNNCIVTRTFRGTPLFLSAVVFGGFTWSTDRSQAVRMESGEATDVARRASDFDRSQTPALVLDPVGQVIEPAITPFSPIKIGMTFDHAHAAGVTRYQVNRRHRDAGYFECVSRLCVSGTHSMIGSIQIFSREAINEARAKAALS